MAVEIYVSTDVETDGPLAGINSMLSFASAAFLADKTLIGSFSANLHSLPQAVSDPKTMHWWQTQPKAWEAIRKDLQEPKAAMSGYLKWLKQLPGKLVFLGYPAAFDFMFINWYLLHFTGEHPFSFSALDIKTYAMAVLKTEFKQTIKQNMPSRWFDTNLDHTHVPLDDALEQGILFCNMLEENFKEK